MRKKLFLAATAGGHLTEILTLLGSLDNTEMVILSEKTSRLQTINATVYASRHPGNALLHMFFCFLKAIVIIIKEKPDWVISTGAECGVAAILAAKLCFRKTIFVETACRYATISHSARICYPLADKFYVQHKDALALYGDKAEYIGGIL